MESEAKNEMSQTKTSVNKQDYEKMLPELRTIVNKVVHNNMADGILFSAGTDTSIIAY